MNDATTLVNRSRACPACGGSRALFWLGRYRFWCVRHGWGKDTP